MGWNGGSDFPRVVSYPTCPTVQGGPEHVPHTAASMLFLKMGNTEHDIHWLKLFSNFLLTSESSFSWLQDQLLVLANGPMISAAAAAKSFQSCPTLCDPIDSSPPGSAVPGILQARTLEWVAISFSSA